MATGCPPRQWKYFINTFGRVMKDKLKTTIDYLKSKGVDYGDIRYVKVDQSDR
jgi:hypothetical protein